MKNLTMRQLVQAGIPFTFDGRVARITTGRALPNGKPRSEGYIPLNMSRTRVDPLEGGLSLAEEGFEDLKHGFSQVDSSGNSEVKALVRKMESLYPKIEDVLQKMQGMLRR